MPLGINSINNGAAFLIKQFTLFTLILISGCAVNNFNDLGDSYRSIKDLMTTQTIDVNELDLTEKLSYAIVQFNKDDEVSAEIVSIKRNKVTKDNLGFFEDISQIINNSNRPLIIFPQGTRVSPDERPPFKKGVSRIYEELNIACQPVAINSGYTWPKKGPKKINSNLIISILKPIEAGLNKEIFLKRLENDIYSELDLLN